MKSDRVLMKQKEVSPNFRKAFATVCQFLHFYFGQDHNSDGQTAKRKKKPKANRQNLG